MSPVVEIGYLHILVNVKYFRCTTDLLLNVKQAYGFSQCFNSRCNCRRLIVSKVITQPMLAYDILALDYL